MSFPIPLKAMNLSLASSAYFLSQIESPLVSELGRPVRIVTAPHYTDEGVVYKIIINTENELLRAAINEKFLAQLTQTVQTKCELGTSLSKESKGVESLIADVYEQERLGESRVAAQKIMIFVDEKLSGFEFIEVNTLLLSIDLKMCSVRSLIALIRSAYRRSAEIPAWKSAFKCAQARVVDLGKDPKKVFIGLPMA